MKGLIYSSLLLVYIGVVFAQGRQNSTKFVKKGKVFQFLTVVKFPNDPCVGGSNKNGTCYTSDECLSKRGISSGSCANAYGVCCVFNLACGQSSSENCTYLSLGATSTTPSPSSCFYTICKCNPNICRIRLDFTTFAINGPQTGSTVAVATDTSGSAIGDCVSDSFSFSSAGNKASPIICGVNTGQHMYVDASQLCNKASFNFGSAAVNRQYDIKVTQYSCQDENGGPPDCLQYYTGSTGTIQSYNFQTKNNVVSSTATHLSNQCYSICFRRNLNKCGICFFPTIDPLAGVTPTIQASFGLSTSRGAAALPGVNTDCASDYLIIPNALSQTITVPAMLNVPSGGFNRFCGRFLNTNIAAGISTSVCTFTRPFKIIFKTDANEVTIVGTAITNEEMVAPGGIIGFQLSFTQISC